jgi:transposase
VERSAPARSLAEVPVFRNDPARKNRLRSRNEAEIAAERITTLERRMPEILADAENGLPGSSRELCARLYAHFKELSRQAHELEQQIKAWHRESTASRRLERSLGSGNG